MSWAPPLKVELELIHPPHNEGTSESSPEWSGHHQSSRRASTLSPPQARQHGKAASREISAASTLLASFRRRSVLRVDELLQAVFYLRRGLSAPSPNAAWLAFSDTICQHSGIWCSGAFAGTQLVRQIWLKFFSCRKSKIMASC